MSDNRTLTESGGLGTAGEVLSQRDPRTVGQLQPGDRFGRYIIRALLGRGGMGEVYRAQDTTLAREVALKILHSEDARAESAARMLREARAAAAIDHPNAVAIFDVGVVDGV